MEKIAKTCDPWPIHVRRFRNSEIPKRYILPHKSFNKFPKYHALVPLACKMIFDRGILESVFTFDRNTSKDAKISRIIISRIISGSSAPFPIRFELG